MVKTILRLAKDESGATAIEYGLIATAGGLAIATAMPGLNSHIANAWDAIAGAVTTAATQ
jgi:pilus assembly protein Flp/PilA